ncbi:MAG TPA: hypothetical protein VFQ23_01685 [Anaerolineales bacterium]|nr:hypothetical protein [Anaerolineales bacterium]
MSLKKVFIVTGLLLVSAALLMACGGNQVTETPSPTGEPTQAPVVPDTPYLVDWQSSAHAAVDTEPFRHWDTEDPAEVPATCARCHTSTGYQDHIGADGTEAGSVEAAVPATDSQGIQCVACHNQVTFSKTTVTFPSGVTITAGDDTRCMECHQGRESKVSVDAQIERFGVTDLDAVVEPIQDDQGETVNFGFRNIHYYAAAATLYGGKTLGGYQYDGLAYDSKNTHVRGYDSCVGCHDPHTLQVRVNDCAGCHQNVATVDDLKSIRMVSSAHDYDGDGNVQEGMFYEIQGLQETLYAEIQKYASDKTDSGIVYDPAAFPYWFADANGDGAADQSDSGAARFSTWTARLLKAAYNYQVSQKDPGAFAHGNKYIVQLLYDSIADLGGDTSQLARTDAAHFAGNTEPFRHWDAEEEGNGVVPFGCVKCHTATGLPAFVSTGGTTVVTSGGTTAIVGLGSMPAGNGFMCTTCHTDPGGGERYTVNSVIFPSGKTVSFGGTDVDGNFLPDDSNLCISCHQGRESTTSMNNALRGREPDTVDERIRFKNIHYFAAGATLFGADVQGAYLYEGKEYLGQNMHADPDGRMNKCQDCHDVHKLEPKVEACETCHGTTDPTTIRRSELDYDGDGDVTEGIHGEIETLGEALIAAMQSYAEAHGGAITYDPQAYPYFFDSNGEGYAAWTPRLVRAAFNYQYIQKDPGAYVHNPKFVMQFLIDSIEDLGGDVSGYIRP